MKPELHFLPPRQSVIYHYTERMLRETGTNRRTFAMVVAEQYLQLVAEDDQDVAFRITRGGTAADGDKKHNGQILGRYLDGVVRKLPADLEDAWVLSLPEPYRSDCERDLARRRKMLAVRMPIDGEAAHAVGVARMATEFGDLMSAYAPALADGRIDAADLPHVVRILDASDDLICAVVAMRRQVQALVTDKAGAQ